MTDREATPATVSLPFPAPAHPGPLDQSLSFGGTGQAGLQGLGLAHVHLLREIQLVWRHGGPSLWQLQPVAPCTEGPAWPPR